MSRPPQPIAREMTFGLKIMVLMSQCGRYRTVIDSIVVSQFVRSIGRVRHSDSAPINNNQLAKHSRMKVIPSLLRAKPDIILNAHPFRPSRFFFFGAFIARARAHTHICPSQLHARSRARSLCVLRGETLRCFLGCGRAGH